MKKASNQVNLKTVLTVSKENISYYVSIIPSFQFSYQEGLLFSFRHDFRNEEGLERSCTESNARRIG